LFYEIIDKPISMVRNVLRCLGIEKQGENMDNDPIEKYLPLSESTYYILLVLIEPIYGYEVMQKVETLTNGEVIIGPGTLYGAFSTLEKEGLIELIRVEDRRKFYMLTEKGRKTLKAQMGRLKLMTQSARQILVETRDPLLMM
jgi:DNA-binding PadR family transcriptional regulator